jgi:hypothetical protein
MAENDNTANHGFEIPEETRRAAKGLIQQAFDLIAEQLRRLRADVDKFDKHRDETQEKINRGARRTDGRIV